MYPCTAASLTVLPGGTLSFTGKWRDIEVTDPLTGEKRQISNFVENNVRVDLRQDLSAAKLAWGMRYEGWSHDADFRLAEIDRYRGIYRAGGSQQGNAIPGRVIYNKVCVQCHMLFDTGGKVGPDITGANRSDLNYLLETIIDPNAVIPNEYRASDIETKDGRNLVGIIKSQDDKSVTLQTANELITIPRAEIASTRQSDLSMMPEGLLQGLADQEVRDLLYYLSRPGQVPLQAASQ